MRELLKQDRAFSPETIRLGVSVLGVLFTLAALMILILGGYTLFIHGDILVGILQLSGGFGLLLALFLLVRLQAELVMAAHRTNDRLMILSDALSPRVSETPPQKPARKKRTSRKAKAHACLLYTSPSPRDQRGSRMPSSA